MTQENKEKKKTVKTKSTPKKPVTKRAVRAKAENPTVAKKTVQSKNIESTQIKPRLKEFYQTDVRALLIKEFSYKSAMQAPTLDKIVVNIGLGEALTNSGAVEAASNDIGLITGQKPIINKAKKSIANFKLREGSPIGVTVTLRKTRMWEFFDRLVASSLPRIRDFRGVPRQSFDGRGNYSIGLREQVIFPEIDYSSVDKFRGLQIVICTTAINDQEGLKLLEFLGMPFVRLDNVTAA
jgi:large subunit ribosomal protein L5